VRWRKRTWWDIQVDKLLVSPKRKRRLRRLRVERTSGNCFKARILAGRWKRKEQEVFFTRINFTPAICYYNGEKQPVRLAFLPGLNSELITGMSPAAKASWEAYLMEEA